MLRRFATIPDYCIELAVAENTLLAFDPISRTVPTTRTNITAYSAISWPLSSDQRLRINSDISPSNSTLIPNKKEEPHSMKTSCRSFRHLSNNSVRIIRDLKQPLKTFRRPSRQESCAGRVAVLTPEHTAIHGREIVPGRGSQ